MLAVYASFADQVMRISVLIHGRDQANAEYVTVPEGFAYRLPEKVPFPAEAVPSSRGIYWLSGL